VWVQGYRVECSQELRESERRAREKVGKMESSREEVV